MGVSSLQEGEERGRVVPLGSQFAWRADTAEQQRMYSPGDPFQNMSGSIRNSLQD